ncbi:MAG: hypothetical protein MJZ34_13780 [Paludibacteraceae bacterium]|nr:hypothetical protein [Paludibacteraceae bacterium]
MDKKVKREIIRCIVEFTVMIILLGVSVVLITHQNKTTVQKAFNKQSTNCEWILSKQFDGSSLKIDPSHKIKLYEQCKALGSK